MPFVGDNTSYGRFFTRRWGREALVFLFFLVLSAGFWLFTALNETYEKEVAVTVQLSGMPANIIIANDVNDTLRVVIRDKGFTFLRYRYGGQLPSLVFDFKSHIRGEGVGSITSSEIQKRLATVFSSSTKVVSVKPERLDFKYDKGVAKKVPIRLAGTMLPADRYYLANEQILPEMATVYALQQTVSKIDCVYTEDINCSDIVDSLVFTARLKEISGVKIEPAEVRVTLYADVMTEQTVDVPITFVGVPDSLVIRTFPAKAEVKFNIGASMVRQIQPEQFAVELNYTDTGDDKEKCEVHLTKMPASVKNAKLVTTEVDYLVETK